MDGFLLQDWTSIRATGATTTVIQAEENWLDVNDYGDIVFWTEVTNVQLGGGTAVNMELETSPSCDESLFLSMATVPLVVGSAPIITKILEGVSTVLPQAYVRWKLHAAGSPANEWGVTFRLHCAAPPRRRG